MHSNAGWSLLEILFILLILLILLSIASPSLERFALQARQTADVNAFVSAVQLARSEAAKQARATVLCTTADWIDCAPAADDYVQGWMVTVESDGDDRSPLARDRPPLLAYEPVMDGTIQSNRDRFVFRPFWRRSTNGTVTFCDRRGTAGARAVIVSHTGRPRVAVSGPGRPLDCGS
jgi:type IV fimbrial biogenesis protein FimT